VVGFYEHGDEPSCPVVIESGHDTAQTSLSTQHVFYFPYNSCSKHFPSNIWWLTLQMRTETEVNLNVRCPLLV